MFFCLFLYFLSLLYVFSTISSPLLFLSLSQAQFFLPESPVRNDADGILIVRYPDGRASGDAFAVFSTEGDVEEALKKHRNNLMGRYIEVFHSSLKEFLVVSDRIIKPMEMCIYYITYLGSKQVWDTGAVGQVLLP